MMLVGEIKESNFCLNSDEVKRKVFAGEKKLRGKIILQD